MVYPIQAQSEFGAVATQISSPPLAPVVPFLCASARLGGGDIRSGHLCCAARPAPRTQDRPRAQDQYAAKMICVPPFPSHQLYSVPVFTTGCTSDSPHSTTMRLLTIEALRSSSSCTTCFSASS